MSTLNCLLINGVEVLLDKTNKNISISSEGGMTKERQMAIFKYLSTEGFLDDEKVFDNKKNVDNEDELW
tara:strand:+ start:1796 stop:2002 length:207 start_codon:yes stop_codon:yes gene_type:complete